MVIMIILFVVTNKNNTMDKNLNCGGGDYGIPASYDVDMCEGCSSIHINNIDFSINQIFWNVIVITMVIILAFILYVGFI